MAKIVDPKPTKVNTKQEVIQVIKDNLDNFAEFGVSEIGLFGSFVREEATPKSDVDLLVKINNHDFDNFCRLEDFANNLFEDRTTDIITENNINEINGIYICREVEYVNQG